MNVLDGAREYAKNSLATAAVDLAQFRSDWRKTLQGGSSMLMSKLGLGPGLDPKSKLDGDNARAKAGGSIKTFGSQFLDGIPVVGEVRALAQGRNAVKTFDGATAREFSPCTKLTVATRAAGTLGTIVGAGSVFSSERDKREEELWRENPRMTRTEVQNEAAYDATAQTAGQVGSTVLAAAATGAAAGTVVPGIGNAAGLVVGVATGVAMSVPLWDSDGDGQRDSLSEAAGDGVEWLADKVPEGARQAVGDVAGTVGDAVSDGVDKVKQIGGGFVNWVQGKG